MKENTPPSEEQPHQPAQHRSITGKVVDDDAAPTHTMSFSRPVKLTPEEAALGFDKKEEEVAACSLRNISKKEVAKRQKISNVGLMVSLGMVAFFIAKDNDFPRYYRVAVTPAFGVWIGYLLSAKAGI